MRAIMQKHRSSIHKQFWNYVFNASYQLLIMAAALVTTPFLARNLGPSDLGIYGYVVSVSAIAHTVTLVSLYTYGSRQIAYCRDSASEVNRVFWELMILRCLLCALESVVYLYVANRTPYVRLFLIYYPWILANALDVTWLFIGFEDMKTVVLKNVAVKVACVLSIFAFVKGNDGLVSYLLIMSSYTLIGNIAVYPQLRQYVSKPDFGSGFLRRHLLGAMKLFIPEVTPTLTHRINHVTMGQVLDSKDDIAFFDQGEKIVNIPSSLVTAMNSVVMPRIANEHARHQNRSIEDYVVWVGSAALMVAIPLSAGVASIADRLVPWFFGPGFERAIDVIRFLSPVIVIDSLIGTVGSQYLTATDRTLALNWSNGIGLLVNVLLNLSLVPMAGCVGAVVSTVVARLAILISQVVVTIDKLSYGRIALSMIRYSAASLAMAAVILLVGRLVVNDITCTIIQIACGCVSYTLLLYMCADPILKALLTVFAREGSS